MTTQPQPQRDLTWLEPRDQQERCRMLDKLDAALVGAATLAIPLGQITTDYSAVIGNLRVHARAERQNLLDEMEAAV